MMQQWTDGILPMDMQDMQDMQGVEQKIHK